MDLIRQWRTRPQNGCQLVRTPMARNGTSDWLEFVLSATLAEYEYKVSTLHVGVWTDAKSPRFSF
jgi:hypothetical protein